jgi:hypothetical protein
VDRDECHQGDTQHDQYQADQPPRQEAHYRAG